MHNGGDLFPPQYPGFEDSSPDSSNRLVRTPIDKGGEANRHQYSPIEGNASHSNNPENPLLHALIDCKTQCERNVVTPIEMPATPTTPASALSRRFDLYIRITFYLFSFISSIES